MTFQEFLETKAKPSDYKERRERRDEWITAVTRLVDQLRTWLKESDPAGILDVVPFVIERAEPKLGSYTIPSLKISVGEAAVQVVPIGRNSVGIVGRRGDSGVRAEGRVDITDGIRKFILYRTLEDGQEKWHAVDEHFQPAPLDRARFEKILQDLLS